MTGVRQEERLQRVQRRAFAYLDRGLVVRPIQQADFDGDGLWPLAGFLGGFGGFAGSLLRAIVLPVVLWNLEAKTNHFIDAFYVIINPPSVQW